MRITAVTVNRDMQNQIATQYDNLANLQEELSTGKRLQKPSDDPIDVSNDLKLRSTLNQTAQYKQNIQDGQAYMSVTDTAMSSMNTLMQRMRELAVQASSDTLTSNDRSDIQAEVQQLTRQFVSLLNTNYKGDYVFGGTQTKVAPYPIDSSQADTAQDYATDKMAYYDPAGQLRNGFDNTPITNIIPGTFSLDVAGTHYVEGTDYTLDYSTGIITPINPALNVPNNPGTANYALGQFKISFDYVGQGKDIYGDPVTPQGDVLRQIEPDVSVPINIPGSEVVFNADTGTNALTALIQFNQRLSTNQTGTTIGQSITDLDSAFSTILAAQAKNGARENMFDTTLTRNEDENNDETEQQSNIEDADMATTITNFSMTSSVYNAALKAASMVIQPTLADYL